MPKYVSSLRVWLGEVPRECCETEQRPCARTSCRYHLLEKRSAAVDELEQSCAIDVADRIGSDGRRGASLRDVAAYMGVTDEMVCKIQKRALRKVHAMGVAAFRTDPDPEG